MQGTEMMRVSDFSTMLAVVDVDENDVVYIKIGDTARIEVDALPDIVLLGTVIEVKNAPVKSQVGTQDEAVNFPVKIRIIDKENRLRPGMSCNVEIATETRNNVIAVPIEAVTVRDSKKEQEKEQSSEGIRKVDDREDKKPKSQRAQSVVFIKDNNIAKMVKVKTGISDKGFIEITEGLNENQEIIIGSFDVVTNKLKDSSFIRVAPLEKIIK
jgi:HlyD family secretion protein